jgi:hypothetical protein
MGVAAAIGGESWYVVLKQIAKTISKERNSCQCSTIATVKTAASVAFVLSREGTQPRMIETFVAAKVL